MRFPKAVLSNLRFAREIKNLTRPKLLIIDEVGYLTLEAAHASLLFQAIGERYEKQQSIVLTSNKAFADWSRVFAGDAIMASAARERLADADAELQRVAHITRQTLGFYRESNAAASVSLSTLVDSVITLLKKKIEEKQVHIEKQGCETNDIRAVAGELRQVFSNLLVNSIKAVDKGGTVKIRMGSCTLSDNREAIRITFADNGNGIEAAIRSQIFEPLHTTKGPVGTGLGLWVSKQIVEKHQGANPAAVFYGRKAARINLQHFASAVEMSLSRKAMVSVPVGNLKIS